MDVVLVNPDMVATLQPDSGIAFSKLESLYFEVIAVDCVEGDFGMGARQAVDYAFPLGVKSGADQGQVILVSDCDTFVITWRNYDCITV